MHYVTGDHRHDVKRHVNRRGHETYAVANHVIVANQVNRPRVAHRRDRIGEPGESIFDLMLR